MTRPRFVLRVLRGLHRGARIAVGARDLVVIGRAEDCDVVLADAGVAPRHVAVRIQADAILLRALDGDFRCKGKRAGPGEMVRIPACTPFALGDALVAIGDRADPFWALLEEPGAKLAAAPPAADPPAAPRAAARLMSRLAALTPRRYAAVACVAAAIALTAMPFVVEPDARREVLAPEARLGALLDELGLGEVQMLLHNDGRLAVEGVVPDHARHAGLVKALGDAGVKAQVRVLVGEQVAQEVKDVFRVNGLAVETRYDVGGVVVVSGFREAGPQVAKVSAHALRDVRGLASIRLEVPADAQERRRLVLASAQGSERRAPVVPGAYGRLDPTLEAMGRGGKRITVVVQGERPYVVTADGRRYFVGSVLPHGYLLAEISGSTVRLERDGEVVVRTF